uniref:histidinol dehydrogenase n=1 Tax=Stieleria sp. TaxID=2795976 RepID=UPI003562D178
MSAPEIPTLNLQRVDARVGSAEILQQLRDKLSPQGDVVSPRGRALTEEVFGAPLTPVEVVQRICAEVQRDGTAALLKFNQQLDKADLTADQLRVPAEDLAAAHAAADPELIDSIRRIRDNVATFQQAILHRDVTIEPKPGVTLTQ